jgi:hypothetical protein
VRVAAERSSALEFFSNGCYNTSAEPAPALTIESLKESLAELDRWFDNWKPARAQRAIVGIDHGAPSGDETASVVGRVDAGAHVTILGDLTAFPIRTSEHLGERVQVRFPMAPKGPYQKRRQKRLNRAPRNWSNCGKGEYWLVDGREVWCHPDDLAKLKQELVHFSSRNSGRPVGQRA